MKLLDESLGIVERRCGLRCAHSKAGSNACAGIDALRIQQLQAYFGHSGRGRRGPLRLSGCAARTPLGCLRTSERIVSRERFAEPCPLLPWGTGRRYPTSFMRRATCLAYTRTGATKREFTRATLFFAPAFATLPRCPLHTYTHTHAHAHTHTHGHARSPFIPPHPLLLLPLP